MGFKSSLRASRSSSTKINGLTDGSSSRFFRGQRSSLVLSIESLKTAGRMEEFLVFEIRMDGGTDYHRFSVRTLYKHVLSAITADKAHDGHRSSMAVNRLAEFGPQNETGKSTPKLDKRSLFKAMKDGVDTLENIEPIDAAEVTYRERLGGFLHPRDMRKLVTPFSASNEPELIVRRHAMLMNFDPLRAIVLRDRVLVKVPDGADSLLVELERRVRAGSNEGGMRHESFAKEILAGISSNESSPSNSWKNPVTGKLEALLEESDMDDSTTDDVRSDKSDQSDDSMLGSFVGNEWKELEASDWFELPFELQSVDAILHSVCTILADDVLDLQEGANGIISDLLAKGADFGDHSQEVLRTMKNSIKEMMSRVQGFERALEVVLEDYEDMTLMNLSRLLTHPERFIQPVSQAILEEESDEPELILESYVQKSRTLTNALSLVQGQINTTEEFAVRKSDTIRNRLLYINMMISILSLAVGMASLVGSVFGMNVINHKELDPDVFGTIVYSTLFGAIGVVAFAFLTIQKLVQV